MASWIFNQRRYLKPPSTQTVFGFPSECYRKLNFQRSVVVKYLPPKEQLDHCSVSLTSVMLERRVTELTNRSQTCLIWPGLAVIGPKIQWVEQRSSLLWENEHRLTKQLEIKHKIPGYSCLDTLVLFRGRPTSIDLFKFAYDHRSLTWNYKTES